MLQRSETSSFSGHWQLPEGKLEKGEKPQEALTRELKEELNVDTKNIELLSANSTPLEARGTKYLAFRIIFDVQIENEDFTISHEHSDYKWVKREDIKDLDLLPGTIESIGQ